MRAFFQLFGLTSPLILCSLLLFPSAAHAYLDPGTGSMALQLLAAGILGALFTLKTHWLRVKSFVLSLFRRAPSSEKNG